MLLENDRLDLAVARGAAYYGMVRRGQGVRIAAGLARTYYIGVGGAEPTSEPAGAEPESEPAGGQPESEPARAEPEFNEQLAQTGSTRAGSESATQGSVALCLVPAGVEPGQDVDLTARQFDLLVSEPVEFPLFVSSTRLTDRPGELLPVDREQMTPLPPIRTVLKTGRRGEAGTVSVQFQARHTEIGTLDLWCSEVRGRRS